LVGALQTNTEYNVRPTCIEEKNIAKVGATNLVLLVCAENGKRNFCFVPQGTFGGHIGLTVVV